MGKKRLQPKQAFRWRCKEMVKNVTSFSAPCERHAVGCFRCFRCFWLIIFDMIQKTLHLVLIVACCESNNAIIDAVTLLECVRCRCWFWGMIFCFASWFLHSRYRSHAMYRFFPCSRCFLAIFFINCLAVWKPLKTSSPSMHQRPAFLARSLAAFVRTILFKSTIDF